MRNSRFTIAGLVFGMAFCLLLQPSAHSQEGTAAAQKVPGFLDPGTGQFTAVTGQHVVPETSTTLFSTGTIELRITINLVSEFPRGTSIACGMNVNVMAQNTTDGAVGQWLETATSQASMNGPTATCTVIIPYYWLLPRPAQDEIRTLNGRFTVTASEPGFTPRVLRSTDQPFLSTTTIPANNTTSSYHVNATL